MTADADTDTEIIPSGSGQGSVLPTEPGHANVDPLAEGPSTSILSAPWSVFWFGMAIASVPILLSYYFDLWGLEHYRFFPFALLVSGWLLHSRWDRVPRGPLGILGWSGVVGCMLLVCLAIVINSPWMGAVGCIGAFTIFCHSNKSESGRSLLLASLPALLTLRLPMSTDQMLVIGLQRVTTTLSSVVLDLTGIPHAVANNVLQLGQRELFVAEACSGIQSVFTLMFIAAALVAINRRPMWTTPLYLLAAIGLALEANVLRVCMIAMADQWFQIDLATGWQHELVGYFALAVGALFLLSFDQLTSTLMHPIQSEASRDNPVLRAWDYLVGGEMLDEDDAPYSLAERIDERDTSSDSPGLMGIAPLRYALLGLCMVVGLGSVVQAYRMRETDLHQLFGTGELIIAIDSTTVGGKLETLSVLDHEESTQANNARLGPYSSIWHCQIEGTEHGCEVVVSQPYREWHDLCYCYEGSNWLLVNRETIEVEELVAEAVDDEAGDSKEPRKDAYIVARFKRGSGQNAYVIYSAVDEDASYVYPPPFGGQLTARFVNVMQDLSTTGEVIMLQLFVSSDEKIEADTIAKLKSDFLVVRSRLQEQVAKGKTLN